MNSVNSRPDLSTPPSATDYGATDSLEQIHSALPSHHRHIWVVTGPAGCGKRTIAQYLAKELSIPYIEGDDHHSNFNKPKKSRADNDRWGELITLREAATIRLALPTSSATETHDGVVLMCSALQRRHRDMIRIAAYDDDDVMVHFIFLLVDEDVLLARMKKRRGYNLKRSVVRLQMEVVEGPDVQEQGKDVLEVDCGGSLTKVKEEVVKRVGEVLANDQ